ncbi:hypothetical protein ACFL6G_09170, partial [candidate division KSB1 bacterium]
GGFIVLFTNDRSDNGVDGFRYGNPDKSKIYANIFGSQVLGFISNKSWKRVFEKSEQDTKILHFLEANPTPGKENK